MLGPFCKNSYFDKIIFGPEKISHFYTRAEIIGGPLSMSVTVSNMSLRYLKSFKIDFLSKKKKKKMAEMMYDMTKKYFHQLLDELHLVLVVEVRKGVQHVSRGT